MAERVKWSLEKSEELEAVKPIPTEILQQILRDTAVTSHFQPIFNAADGRVFGYEALSRIVLPGRKLESPDIASVFHTAQCSGQLGTLDALCRTKALQRAGELNFSDGHLFINVCPETLMAEPREAHDRTAELVQQLGIPRKQVVFEITEESAVTDYQLFRDAVNLYREQGYKIAIDDFGVGYGGLKMLAILEPDFVKIDRHFVREINRAIVKRNLVDSVATACHRLGIKVIAEGIEDEEDLATVLDMGIEFAQGYGLARPSTDLLPPGFRFAMPNQSPGENEEREIRFIGEIAQDCPTLPPSATVHAARALFTENPNIMSLPVVEGERLIAILHRRPFFERVISGRLGYGESLAAYKSLGQIAGDFPYVTVDARDTLEETSRRLATRSADERYNDICVTSSGKYLGTVEVSALLAAITQRSLDLARGANPLSGLPGNEAIRREIELRIGQKMHFDCCYIDIDNFKPFNDTYGFERGDEALRYLAKSVGEAIREEGAANDFAGHIGGDDFLVITRPQTSLAVCRAIMERFSAAVPDLHNLTDDFSGVYSAVNRRGEMECYSLMSLSIGIVSTEVSQFKSFAELASIASEVKKAAKAELGSCVVRDRRLLKTEVAC